MTVENVKNDATNIHKKENWKAMICEKKCFEMQQWIAFPLLHSSKCIWKYFNTIQSEVKDE